MAKVNNPQRFAIYERRVKDVWKSLDLDIKRWQENMALDEMIRHNLKQFDIFRREAYERMMNAYTDQGWKAEDDRIEFESLVIGTLTSQWSWLRQVACQEQADTLYQAGRSKFGEEAVIYYNRLFKVLPPGTQDALLKVPPLVFIGHIPQTTYLKRNAPAVISLPLGALDDLENGVGGSVLQHEIGHALFYQIPDFFEQLRDKIPVNQENKKERSLHKMMVDWMPEIVAELAGTALAGKNFSKFIDDAIWITICPDNKADVTDKKHPPSPILPYIHLELLKYFAEKSPDFNREYEAEIREKEIQVDDVFKDLLSGRFRSIQVLAFISLEEIKNKIFNIIRTIVLPTQINGKSLEDILFDCINDTTEDKEVVPQEWGNILEDEFVLDLPDSTSPGSCTSTSSTSYWSVCKLTVFGWICYWL